MAKRKAGTRKTRSSKKAADPDTQAIEVEEPRKSKRKKIVKEESQQVKKTPVKKQCGRRKTAKTKEDTEVEATEKISIKTQPGVDGEEHTNEDVKENETVENTPVEGERATKEVDKSNVDGNEDGLDQNIEDRNDAKMQHGKKTKEQAAAKGKKESSEEGSKEQAGNGDPTEQKQASTKKDESPKASDKDKNPSGKKDREDGILSAMMEMLQSRGSSCMALEKVVKKCNDVERLNKWKPKWQNLIKEGFIEPADDGKKGSELYQLTQKGIDRSASEKYKTSMQLMATPAKTTQELHENIPTICQNKKCGTIVELLLKHGSLSRKELAALMGTQAKQTTFFYGLKKLMVYGYVEDDPKAKFHVRLSDKAFVNSLKDRPKPNPVDENELLAAIEKAYGTGASKGGVDRVPCRARHPFGGVPHGRKKESKRSQTKEKKVFGKKGKDADSEQDREDNEIGPSKKEGIIVETAEGTEEDIVEGTVEDCKEEALKGITKAMEGCKNGGAIEDPPKKEDNAMEVEINNNVDVLVLEEETNKGDNLEAMEGTDSSKSEDTETEAADKDSVVMVGMAKEKIGMLDSSTTDKDDDKDEVSKMEDPVTTADQTKEDKPSEMADLKTKETSAKKEDFMELEEGEIFEEEKKAYDSCEE